MPLLLFQRKEAKIICNIDKVKFTSLLIQLLPISIFQSRTTKKTFSKFKTNVRK